MRDLNSIIRQNAEVAARAAQESGVPFVPAGFFDLRIIPDLSELTEVPRGWLPLDDFELDIHAKGDVGAEQQAALFEWARRQSSSYRDETVGFAITAEGPSKRTVTAFRGIRGWSTVLANGKAPA